MPGRSIPHVDPGVLGKILLIQTTIHALPTPASLSEFVGRGLEEMPGAGTVVVRINDPSGSATVSPAVESRVQPSSFSSQHFTIGIQTLHRSWGSIDFESSERAFLEPYQPFLESLANTIALTLENKAHGRKLEELNHTLLQAKEELETLVQKRTSALIQTNETLAREIEERKKFEQNLRESEHKYRDLFENANDAIFLLDVNLRFVDVNRKAVELLGYTKDEFLGMTIDNLYSEEPATAASKSFFNSTKASSSKKFITKLRTHNAQFVDVEVSSSPIIKDGKFVGSRDVVRDITDRMRIEKDLRQAQKNEAIGTLAGGIAHDFNNILTALLGNAELASASLSSTDPAKKYLDRILGGTQRAADLVRQILTFSRQSGEEKTPLRLQPVVKEALKFIRASIPTNIEIVQNVCSETPVVLTNPTQIHQVVMNLCTNAYHAMRPGGGVLRVSLHRVTVGPDESEPDRAIAPGDYALLEVQDTGCGMNAATKARIFDPYFTTKEKGEGTGLGLSVVHGIVRHASGHIRVISEPGKGSTFEVYLPATETVQSNGDEKSNSTLPLGHERIWIVDDEQPILEVERELLESLGYQVRAFTQANDLLTAFQEQPQECDLIITDLGMPKMSGADLAEHLLKLRPNIPIILCSGYSETLSREDAIAMGIREFLTKPVNRESIAQSVRKFLNEKQDEQAGTGAART